MDKKLKEQPKKIARSFYAWLPWHTKLLVPVVVVTALLFGLAWVAELFI